MPRYKREFIAASYLVLLAVLSWSGLSYFAGPSWVWGGMGTVLFLLGVGIALMGYVSRRRAREASATTSTSSRRD